MGRLFTPADDRRGCGTPGAVLSHGFWKSELGGDPLAIGRKLTLNGHPVEVIGVTPAGFFGLNVGRSFQVALPICSEPSIHEYDALSSGTFWWLSVMGRRKPGWSAERAAAEVAAISPAVFESSLPPRYPPVSVKGYLAMRLIATPAATGISGMRADYSEPLWLLLAIAAMVLTIACANLANLMLARGSAREREMAVRMAIGAGRGRLLRQLMAESLALAAGGAGLGFAVSRLMSGSLVALLATADDAVFLDLRPDWRVLGFAAALAGLTALLFGLAPALRATAAGPGEVLRSAGRGITAGRGRFALRRMLVVAQVALSLVPAGGCAAVHRNAAQSDADRRGFQPAGNPHRGPRIFERRAGDRRALRMAATAPGAIGGGPRCRLGSGYRSGSAGWRVFEQHGVDGWRESEYGHGGAPQRHQSRLFPDDGSRAPRRPRL